MADGNGGGTGDGPVGGAGDGPVGGAAGGGYLLDNSVSAAGERLDALAAVFDGTTQRHLEDLGVTGGWRCWEVGAGGPSVVRWLAGRVGADGWVLATDIDTTWLSPAEGPGVEIRRHDVAADPPPGDGIDLVHARLELTHHTDRRRVLATLVDALRPGGLLLIEDADPGLQPLSSIDPDGPEDELANRLRTGFRAMLAGRGADLAFGRTLPRLLREAGLVDVAADAYLPVALPDCARLETATIAFIRDRLVEYGVATPEEIDRHLGSVAAGRLDLAQPPLVSAWGRRPTG